MLLAATSYDPASASAGAATSAALAMTALDTTNLRLTFTAPASGNVAVRARVPTTGYTAAPSFLLGVLESTTVVLRMVPTGNFTTGLALNANNTESCELYGIVTGVAAGSHTWDLAYGVEVVASGGVLKWGGPNDGSGADAWGAATFEIWDPGSSLLAAKVYDPSSAASIATTLNPMTAFDTANLRLTFTAPASGNVFWRIRTLLTAASTAPLPSSLLGILEGAAVVARQAPCQTIAGASSTTFADYVLDASGIITGVSAGSHNYDAARAIQLIGGSANYRWKYGGPNDTTVNNAWGGFLFELWAA